MLQRNIYEIIVVSHENGEIIANERKVATSSESAMAKIGLTDICAKVNISTDDVEYVILKLGSLRAIQEVKNTDAKGI